MIEALEVYRPGVGWLQGEPERVTLSAGDVLRVGVSNLVETRRTDYGSRRVLRFDVGADFHLDDSHAGDRADQRGPHRNRLATAAWFEREAGPDDRRDRSTGTPGRCCDHRSAAASGDSHSTTGQDSGAERPESYLQRDDDQPGAQDGAVDVDARRGFDRSRVADGEPARGEHRAGHAEGAADLVERLAHRGHLGVTRHEW